MAESPMSIAERVAAIRGGTPIKPEKGMFRSVMDFANLPGDFLQNLVVKGNVELDGGISGLRIGPDASSLGAGAGAGCGGRGATRLYRSEGGDGMEPTGQPGRYTEYGSPIGEF